MAWKHLGFFSPFDTVRRGLDFGGQRSLSISPALVLILIAQVEQLLQEDGTSKSANFTSALRNVMN